MWKTVVESAHTVKEKYMRKNICGADRAGIGEPLALKGQDVETTHALIDVPRTL